MLIGALPLLALAGPVAPASAEVESSQITSPAGPTYALYDETLPSPQNAFTVTGTTTGSGNIALRCYYGPGPTEYKTLVKKVEPSGGAFSVEVEAKELYFAPCVLRAVPFGIEEAHPPGTPAEESKDPFQGPRIIGSRFELFSENKAPYDYEFEANSLSGDFQIDSVGDCGLAYSNLYAPNSLTPSEHLFDCNAFLYLSNSPPSEKPTPTRSELQVDGANAYGPATASYVNEEIQKALESKKETPRPVPGAPQVTVTQSVERMTGLVKITEVDPIVRCSPSTAFPPTAASCTSFVSTGVQLERTWQTSNADQVAAMTDTWKSTDGAAHSLNALYNQTTVDGGKAGGAYQFPGTNVFSATTKGETVTLPPGLGRIYYKQDAETPSEGDGKHPQGAIVYDTPPSGPLSVYQGTAAEGYNGFEMPYQATIPAGGSYTLRMAFIQAYKLSEVESLASAVLAGYPASEPPALSIISPANGTTVSSPSVTVSGTVTDKRVITSFTVDGKPVSVAANGAWSTSVALSKGANTIKALATDQAGFSTEKSVSVTYTPPPPPSVHATQVGSASGANGQVRFMILCSGPAGTSCEIEALLTTVEKTHNGRPIAVSARRHHHGTRSTQVTVGSSKLTIPAGQRVTIEIPLNASGQSLLTQFGKLPVHLTAVQTSAGHHSTVIAQNLTVTPHRKPRHHHHHRRHHHHHPRRG
jgi:Glucodextranase, domain B